MNTQILFLLIGSIFFNCLCLTAQQNKGPKADASNLISSIHPMEKIKGHYATLSKLDARKSGQENMLDTIAFQPELYSGYAILFSVSTPAYLTNDQFQFLIRSIDYPANSSIQTRAELDFLLDWQNKRTEQDIDRVMKLAKLGYWPDANMHPENPKYEQNLKDLFFECREVVGDQCTHENYPMTSKLLQGVMNDMRKMEYAVKYRLLRPRPYQINTRLKPLQVMGSPSFASGHTLWAYIQAYTFSELMPEKRNAFLDIAYELGLSREIMGVHYPSDEENARQLAHRMLMLMWHTQKFQEDFAAAKKEWE